MPYRGTARHDHAIQDKRRLAVNDGAFHELLVTISGNQTAIDVNQERFAIKKSPLMASQAADDLDVRITLGQLRSKFKYLEIKGNHCLLCILRVFF